MDLNAVQMFIQSVQAGSLSAGAERAGIPLATLSRQVRKLERQLGIQLLERSVRGIRLTDAGMRLYEHATRGLDAFAEAERSVRSDQAQLRGRLRLSLPTVFEPWWELIAAFQRQFPNIEVNVYSTDRRIDHLQDGIDVALRVGAITHEAMLARRLLSYRHVVVAAPLFLERFGQVETIEVLQGLPCAAWCRDANSRPVWRFKDQTIEPRTVMTTNDYLHLRQLVVAGDVLTELPPFLAAEALESGKLREVLPHQPLPAQEVNLLYPLHRNPSSIVRAYLDFCQKSVHDYVRVADIGSKGRDSESGAG
ncbi:LysR family transcriptional regulator [Rhizobium sp. C4]|uniref:LysR family transcriptional regulator n=1 Tax=Rhizobium sp. C4 TaxID=1349800 RepID=UPI001E5A5C6C|nr:LysR family transcriptional regulator [Rhizobium sp. C4]MCD2176159.1 LysR substrate-binding domain-containing protein [Rhizobium sp. C4]